jgi:hypothetical protein
MRKIFFTLKQALQDRHLDSLAVVKERGEIRVVQRRDAMNFEYKHRGEMRYALSGMNVSLALKPDLLIGEIAACLDATDMGVYYDGKLFIAAEDFKRPGWQAFMSGGACVPAPQAWNERRGSPRFADLRSYVKAELKKIGE